MNNLAKIVEEKMKEIIALLGLLPNKENLEKLRATWDDLIKIEDQGEVLRALEPLMEKIQPWVLQTQVLRLSGGKIISTS